MLLARLGLRAVEVSRLELDDLHWRAGEIEVDGKGHERGRLPLPRDVGEALVGYLALRGRSASRRVFLTVHAPTRPIESSGVSTVVRDACRRAGAERVGAHRLRHALASELLAEGASLTDIGQVLRHKPRRARRSTPRSIWRVCARSPSPGRGRHDHHVYRPRRGQPAAAAFLRLQAR